ncbi:hypothetical protein J3U99_22525 [Brucella pituitosa]|uniref:hypothetical protein n=1 Tax=Brucella pituitosa TaxID=571256 RepID=UPI002003D7B3|nr:hypothetical protein [Brucella pituitosa]MCK4207537.1 hypothetical protein [Brucella pituitosa]
MSDEPTFTMPPLHSSEEELDQALDQIRLLADNIEHRHRKEPRNRPHYRYTELERALVAITMVAQEALGNIKAMDFPSKRTVQ